jgi:hypothetical protein
VNRWSLVGHPEWLPAGTARAIAEAAGAVVRRDSPEDAKAAVRPARGGRAKRTPRSA